MQCFVCMSSCPLKSNAHVLLNCLDQVRLLFTPIFLPLISDLPSIVSSSQIGVIDPHEEYFGNGKDRRTGHRWRLKEDRAVMDSIPDQFLPYKGIFHCTDDAFSKGTYDKRCSVFRCGRYRPSCHRHFTQTKRCTPCSRVSWLMPTWSCFFFSISSR